MSWWKKIKLRVRILVILSLIVIISFCGGSIMIWYTYKMDELFSVAIDRNVASLEAAEELEIALVKQKGFLSYYFINGDPNWLSQLEETRHDFLTRLERAYEYIGSEDERKTLDQIKSGYDEYSQYREKVIALYKSGEKEAGLALHEQIRGRFFGILGLCDDYKELHKKMMKDALAGIQNQARYYRLISGFAISVVVLLAGLLAFILISEILEPIRKLTGLSGKDDETAGGDEVMELQSRIQGLVDDADQTRSELVRSRKRLMQAEKMAVIGNLAADVAHSIRNPMTSIKMRLFSLQRSLELSANQKEDFDVVSEEMRRLDNIVRNFLEFSRPPKLKKQVVNVSELLDMTIELLQHRIELHEVKIERHRYYKIPPVNADPELLKEVLVNLIVNALEAMKEGGKLIIHEEEAVAEDIGRAVLIKISDTGPGIPEPLQDKIFEPFFSTKEDGTGLGLPIAMRIVEEHGGGLSVRSEEGKGATFIIALPIREEN